MFNPCFYYYLQKPQQDKKLLAVDHKQNQKGFIISLQEQQHTQTRHLWMFKSADLDNIYYIYHCQTGLVLEVGKENAMQMHHFRNKDTQKFKINPVSTQKKQYVISQYMKGAVLFTKNQELACDSSGQLNITWTIKRAVKNRVLFESAIIQVENSGAVLEVADNAQKEFSSLQQNDWTGMFAQRWFLEPHKEFYFIRNAKSHFVITVKNKKTKQAAQLIQEKDHENDHKHQLWSIEQRGHRIYSIRLASEQSLYIGIKHYWKGGSSALLVTNDNKNLWRIITSQKL